MTFSVSGNLNGRWEIRQADTATEAAAIADQFKELGVVIVHIKKDGIRLLDADEFDQMILEEAKAK